MDDAVTCPLCGGPNQCGVAQGKSDCWCFATTVPAAVLDTIPDEDRSTRCICQRCAEASTSQPPASPPDA